MSKTQRRGNGKLKNENDFRNEFRFLLFILDIYLSCIVVVVRIIFRIIFDALGEGMTSCLVIKLFLAFMK